MLNKSETMPEKHQTEQRESCGPDQAKTAEEEPGYRLKFEKLITSISTRFVNLPSDKVDEEINDALRKLGEFMGVDRGYVFLGFEDKIKASNTHEWAAEGVEPKTEELQNMETAAFPWLTSKILNKEVVHIPRVTDLPKEATAEKEEFVSEDLHSLVIVPLIYEDAVFGFLGFDSVWKEKTWDDDTIAILRIVGEIFASALERKRMDEELHYLTGLEKFVSAVSVRFINLPAENISEEIENALGELGEFIDVDRAYIYIIEKSGKRAIRAHSWEASGLKSVSGEQKELEYEDIKWSGGGLLKGEVLSVSSVESLPRAARSKIEYMRQHGIRAMVCVPFRFGDVGRGYFALCSEHEQRKWTDEIISLLKIVAEIFANAMAKKEESQKLDQEQRLFKTLMDNIPDNVYFKDKKSRFIRINKSLARWFGFDDPQEVIGKTDFEVFSKEHASEAYADEQKIIKTGEPVVGKEEKETWPDGSATWVSTTKAPLYNNEGDVVGTFGVSRDITARKRAEEERQKIEVRMQQAQKLESLGLLSGGIAHDFNNLLMGILGNTSLALMELPAESPAWMKIKEIETVALRATELTNEMLAYSGRAKFIVKPFNLTNLVREMAHFLKVSISDKIKLEQNLSEDIPAMDGDPTQIRQVIMNLLTNASDAIGKKRGTITVTTGVAECDKAYFSECYVAETLPAGWYVSVEVSDTGCGMDKEMQKKIFDPFFTTKASGRGLGLTTVLGIVRGHRGALRVYSELERGSTFRVLFPCSSKKIEEVKTAPEQTQQWSGDGTILIVDDDEAVCTVTEQMLNKLGFSVITAKNGQAAVRHYKKFARKITAILLDIALPGVSGEEVLEKIRRIRRDVPVILISGYNEKSAVVSLPAGSYEGFLQKPYNMDMLTAKLKEILEKKQA